MEKRLGRFGYVPYRLGSVVCVHETDNRESCLVVSWDEGTRHVRASAFLCRLVMCRSLTVSPRAASMPALKRRSCVVLTREGSWRAVQLCSGTYEGLVWASVRHIREKLLRVVKARVVPSSLVQTKRGLSCCVGSLWPSRSGLRAEREEKLFGRGEYDREK